MIRNRHIINNEGVIVKKSKENEQIITYEILKTVSNEKVTEFNSDQNNPRKSQSIRFSILNDFFTHFPSIGISDLETMSASDFFQLENKDTNRHAGDFLHSETGPALKAAKCIDGMPVHEEFWLNGERLFPDEWKKQTDNY